MDKSKTTMTEEHKTEIKAMIRNSQPNEVIWSVYHEYSKKEIITFAREVRNGRA